MPEKDLLEQKLKSRLYDYEVREGRPLFDAIYKEVSEANKPLRYPYYVAAATVVLAVISFTFFNFFQPGTENVASSAINTTSIPNEVIEKEIENEQPAKKVNENSVLAKKQVTSVPVKTIKVTEVVATYRNQKVDLPDGSTVYLEKGASLSYKSNFGEESRKVKLKGIGFFEIEKKADLPFMVTTSNSQTTVTGTSFNIVSLAEKEEIQVVSGSVLFEDKTGEKVILKAGMQAKVNSPDIEVQSNISDNALAWRTGNLKFTKEPLKNVVSDLEAFWGKTISVENEDVMNCNFTGKFSNPGIEDVMQLLSLTLDVQWVETDDQIVISGKGCSTR